MKMFLLTIIISLFSLPAMGQIAVIAHSEVPVDSISKEDLLDYYAGDIREWENEQPIVVFDLKSRLEIREKFFDFLGKSSSRMRSIWLKKLLSGEGDPPDALESEAKVVNVVADTPGSIGFVNLKLINSSVKILMLIE